MRQELAWELNCGKIYSLLRKSLSCARNCFYSQFKFCITDSIVEVNEYAHFCSPGRGAVCILDIFVKQRSKVLFFFSSSSLFRLHLHCKIMGSSDKSVSQVKHFLYSHQPYLLVLPVSIGYCNVRKLYRQYNRVNSKSTREIVLK